MTEVDQGIYLPFQVEAHSSTLKQISAAIKEKKRGRAEPNMGVMGALGKGQGRRYEW